MSNQPEGRTFRERWPDDAATADWIAGPWMPIAVGGLVGVVGFPLLVATIVTTWPLAAALLLAVVGIALPLARRRGRIAGIARAVAAVAAYLLLIAVGGYLVGEVSVWLLGNVCPASGCEGGVRQGPAVVVPVTLLLGSVAVGIAAAFAVARLMGRPARPPVVVDPAAEAWRARRIARSREDGESRD